jgi:hypothetical protein
MAAKTVPKDMPAWRASAARDVDWVTLTCVTGTETGGGPGVPEGTGAAAGAIVGAAGELNGAIVAGSARWHVEEPTVDLR